ncbi:MAG: hypothetical protein RLZZ338_1416 [Cyanobacteriota bacterium]|jgi:micrococcal nuclease
MKKTLTLGISLITIALFSHPVCATQSQAQVLNIIDGDTFNVKIDNRKEKIRLACVDAPEGKQVGGVEATKFLSGLIPVGSKVTILETGRDRYQRFLGVVFNGKTNINLEMVSNGYAIVSKQYLSKCPSFRQDLVKAEAIAKSQKLNLWNNPNFCSPQSFRQKKC